MDKLKFRIESDSIGEKEIPAEHTMVLTPLEELKILVLQVEPFIRS